MKGKVILYNLAWVVLFVVLIFFLEFYSGIKIQRADIDRIGGVRVVRLKENVPNQTRTYNLAGTNNEYLVQKGSVTVTYDENGFIPSPEYHNDPELKIIFIGGSTTECRVLDADKRFPYLAGKLLEEKTGKNVNTWNAGVSGNNSMHSNTVMLTKILPLKPDIVVMLHNTNDLGMLELGKDYWSQKVPGRNIIYNQVNDGKEKKIRSLIREHGGIFAKIFPNIYERYFYFRLNKLNLPEDHAVIQFDEYWQTRDDKSPIQVETLTEQYENSLQLFIQTCKAYDITPVLMTQNFVYDTDSATRVEKLTALKAGSKTEITREEFRDENNKPGEYYEIMHHYFNDIIRKICTSDSILCVDLANQIEVSEDKFYDKVHYTEIGSEAVSRVIAETLAPNITKEDQP